MTVSNAAWTKQTPSPSRSQYYIDFTPTLGESQGVDLTPSLYPSGDLDALATAIVSRLGAPVNAYAIAAFLESEGWSDDHARAKYGADALLSLGERLWEKSWQLPVRTEALIAPSAGAQGDEHSQLHLRGFYLLALATVQLLGLIWVGVAFGVGKGFSQSEATAVGLGLLLGLIWANGFGQLLAREPLNLHLSDQDVLAGRAILRLLTISLGLAGFAAIIVVAVTQWTGVATIETATLAAASFFLLALFWMLVNALFVIDLAPLALASAILALTFLVLAEMVVLPAYQVWTPAFGFLVADLVMMLCLLVWWLARRIQHRSKTRLSSLKAVWLEQWAYAAYGFGVMLLIVLDRLVVWWAGAEATGLAALRYEAALGWALLAFLVMAAGQEWLLATFLRDLRSSLRQFGGAEILTHQAISRRSYRRRLMRLVGFVSIVGVSAGVLLPWLERVSPSVASLLPTGADSFIFWLGLLGYGLLVLSMLNMGFVIAMSQPTKMLAPLALALGVDLVTVVAAMRLFGYAGGVLGLVAGASVLFVFSALRAHRLMGDLLRVYYASA